MQTTRKSELNQLKEGLNSRNFEEKKNTLKKVIAQMTMGKDLSQLFQSVIKCLEFQDLDIKKLVYLYIINYSRSKPDDAIMSINLFRRDAINKNSPIVRALAVRTMSSLRTPKLNEYLVQPLKVALADEDPYVRKTAVLSIPKVYQIAPDLPETKNLVSLLEVIATKQPNALVLANAIASLEEISLISGEEHITVDSGFLSRLLVALNECMQWGQVFILDFLCKYDPKNESEAEMIIDRVIPRLSHINPSVTFGSIKLIVRYLDFLTNQDLIKNLVKKLAPSIVSVVTLTPDQIQYVILKNIQYIIAKRPMILQNDIKCFFCKFSDPYYVKNEKIEILIRIINYKNYEYVLDELKQYILEIDPEFVKNCIRAIGKIAIRFQKSIEKCMIIIARQIKTTKDVVSHTQIIVNQLLITTQFILRKYPSKYNFNSMFLDLVALFQYASQPYAKQAAVWILGQYAQEIYDVSMQTFKRWINNFESEDRIVQLQILSSAVKVFIKYPDQFEVLISDLLSLATQNVSNPDVRDRAFIYWRMLSTDPQKTKNVVFCFHPQSKENDKLMDSVFLNEIMKSMGQASSLYQKRPQQLFQKSVAQQRGIKIETQEEEEKVGQQMLDKIPTQNISNSNTNKQPIELERNMNELQSNKIEAKQQNLLDLM